MHDSSLEFYYSEYSDIPVAEKFGKEEYRDIKDVAFDWDCRINPGSRGYSDEPESAPYVEDCELNNIVVWLTDGVAIDYPNDKMIPDPLHKQLITDIFDAYFPQVESEILGH